MNRSVWKEDMRRVFEKALDKAEKRLKQKGYVEKPWRDWDGDLRDRLHKEIEEWRHEVVYGNSKTAEQSKLEDMINCAAFQHLRLEDE